MHVLNFDSSHLLNWETGACALNGSFNPFEWAGENTREVEAKDLQIGAVARKSLPNDTFSSASDNTFQYILITPRNNQTEKNQDLFSIECQNQIFNPLK